jgi:hypothetical protein
MRSTCRPSALHLEVEMVMLFRRDAGRQHAQVAGHAEVDDQRAVLEMDQQVLAAAPSAATCARPAVAVARAGRASAGRRGAAPRHARYGLRVRRDAAPGDFNFW